MFDYVDMLQGPSAGAVDSDEEDGKQAPGETHPGQGAKAEESGGAFNLWGMASALAENVKKSTAEIAASVKETDWAAEIELFRKGVAEDGVEAGQAVRDGLGSFELPRPGSLGPMEVPSVTAALPAGLGAGLEGLGDHFSAGVESAQVHARLNQAATRLRGLGSSLLTGTSELLGQVSGAISAELDSIEGMAARARHQAGPLQMRAPPPQRSRARAPVGAAKPYSRLDAEISAMQRNSSTYCDEPEDRDDYEAWLAGFDLSAKRGDIDAIVARNAFMAELQQRIVPLIVRYEAFWTRYFYQLHKLQQKHEQRQEAAQAGGSADEQPTRAARVDGPNDASSVPVVPVKPAASAPASTEPEEKLVQATTAHSLLPTVTVQEAAVAAKPDDRSSSASTPVALKVVDDHSGSDVDTSTASEESGGHAWTVVTSPSARAAARAKAEWTVEAPAHPSKEGDDITLLPMRVAHEEGEAPEQRAPEAAVQSPQQGVADEEVSEEGGEAPRKRVEEAAGLGAPAAAASVIAAAAVDSGAAKENAAQPAKPAAGRQDEDEDLEISDEEGAAAAGEGDSDVDEDWGGDWE